MAGADVAGGETARVPIGATVTRDGAGAGSDGLRVATMAFATAEGGAVAAGATLMCQPINTAAAMTLIAAPNISLRGSAPGHRKHATCRIGATSQPSTNVRRRWAADAHHPSSGHAGGSSQPSASDDSALGGVQPGLAVERTRAVASDNARGLPRLRRRASSSARFQRFGLPGPARSLQTRRRDDSVVPHASTKPARPGDPGFRSHESSVIVEVKPSTVDSSQQALPQQNAVRCRFGSTGVSAANSPHPGGAIRSGLRRRFMQG